MTATPAMTGKSSSAHIIIAQTSSQNLFAAIFWPCYSAAKKYICEYVKASETMVALIFVVGFLSGGLALAFYHKLKIRSNTNNAAVLDEKNALLELAEETANIGHWHYDTATKTVTWSDQIYSIHGVTKENYTPSIDSAFLFYHPDDRQRVQDVFSKALEKKENFQFFAKIVQPDGNVVHVSSVGLHRRDAAGNVLGVFGVFQDVTESKKAEVQQNALLERLTHSNAELQRFAYIASHDLQEPVRMVASFTEIIQARSHDKLDEETKKYLTIVHESAVRMKALINDLLEYAVIEQDGNNHEIVPIKKIVDSALSNLSDRIERTNAKIIIGELPTVKNNPSRLLSLFQNLISNSLKYQLEGQEPVVHIDCTTQDGVLEFCIRDNGIGMNEAYAEKIFEPFQRLHQRNEYSGTGIGLSICRRIVEGFGGNIWVESKEDNGCSVFFTLPLEQPETASYAA